MVAISNIVSFRSRVRYNILTPVALLAAGLAGPSFAATTTITTPTLDVVIAPGDSLVNESTITRSANTSAVSAPGNVDTLLNDTPGVIDGNTGSAISIIGTVNSLNNAGTIQNNTAVAAPAITVGGHVTQFINTGTVSSTQTDSGYTSSQAVVFNSGVDSFLNTGTMTSSLDTGYAGTNV